MKIIQKTTYEDSWAQIKDSIVKGRASRLQSGSQIPITLKNGEELVLDVARDQKGKIYFVFHDCLSEHVMNKERTNAGGWEKCEMRRHANEEVFALLPDDLQAVIEPTKVVQMVNGQRVETMDKLFCLSATQVFGPADRWSSQEPEDTQLDIFQKERGRVKGCGNRGTWYWWLRSADDTSNFRIVYPGGSVIYYHANYALGVALSFCLNPESENPATLCGREEETEKDRRKVCDALADTVSKLHTMMETAMEEESIETVLDISGQIIDCAECIVKLQSGMVDAKLLAELVKRQEEYGMGNYIPSKKEEAEGKEA